MKEIYNPSMQEEPYNHRTRLIPMRNDETMLDWLERTGRLISRDLDADEYDTLADELVDEIIEPEAYQEEEADDAEL